MPNKKLPGTEQTVLNVIAWVRSQVYRHSPRHERIYYKDLRTNLLGLTIPYYLRIKESLLLIRWSIYVKKVLLDSVTWVRAKPKFTS